MDRPLIPAVLIAATVLAACGDAAPPEEAATATVDTVDGVERLRFTAERATPLGWTADTVAILGDAFAEDVYQFNDVSSDGLAGGRDGSLLVLDRQGKRVLEYGPAGEHRATYGREGEGPGELTQPLGLTVGPGDTVWVSDFSNSRLTGYPSDGGEPRVIPFPDNSGVPTPRFATVDAGHLLQFRPLFNFRRGSGGGLHMNRGAGSEEDQAPMIPLVRFGRDALEPRDTLWTVPEPPSDMTELEIGGRFMITMMQREFYPDFLWAAFEDGGIVLSDTAAYVLRLLAADGTVVRRIERDPPPRPTTDADREAARERVREESASEVEIRIGGGGPEEDVRQQMLEQRLEKMTFAELVPRVLELRVDPLDRIWVGVSEDVAGEIERIDIYDRDGRLLGELRDFDMPDVFLGPDRIGILRRDELDVQQVVLLEVRGAGDRVAGGE